MAKTQKLLISWLPTLLWAGLIFFMSSRPTVTAAPNYWHDFFLKKLAHLTEYFIFTVLLYRSLKHTTNLSRVKLLLFTFVTTVLYAASDEYHQSLIPGRQPALRDVAIDAIGGLLALFLVDKKVIRI